MVQCICVGVTKRRNEKTPGRKGEEKLNDEENREIPFVHPTLLNVNDRPPLLE